MPVPKQEIHLTVPRQWRKLVGSKHVMVDLTGRIHRDYDGWCIDNDKGGVLVQVRRTRPDIVIMGSIVHEGFHLVQEPDRNEAEKQLNEEKAMCLEWFVMEASQQLFDIEAK